MEDANEMKWLDLELEKSMTASDIGLQGSVCGEAIVHRGNGT